MGSALAPDRPGASPARRPGTIRVMVIDDSITARSALVRTIDARRDMTVVATAGSAEVGLELLADKAVDVILLDLEMPGMGGLRALPSILEKSCGAQVLVVSSLTTAGAEHTLSALAMGAADTLAKPSAGNFGEAYRGELLGKIVALAQRAGRTPAPVSPTAPAKPALQLRTGPGVIAIGASTGGIHALGRFFGALPRGVDCPILVTQHLPEAFMPVFARQIATMSHRPASIAQDGMALRRGEVLIAPGSGHMSLRSHNGDVVVEIVQMQAASGCCPSVDPMFEAVAEHFGRTALGVVLSGMGRDGSIGAQSLARAGGLLLAQDEESCAVFGMPRGLVEAGLAHAVRAPEDLARMIGDKGAAV